MNKKNSANASLNRWVLRDFLKLFIPEDDQTHAGREFHNCGAEELNDLSPYLHLVLG